MLHSDNDLDAHRYLPLDQQLFHLSIRGAAELTVVDMWISGDLPDVPEPDGWSESEWDPKLLKALKGEVDQFCERIAAAVDAGRLKAENVLRDFDEKLIADSPVIDVSDLESWLLDHEYLTGDAFRDWKQTEAEISHKLSEELHYLRALGQLKKGAVENQGSRTLMS